MTKVTYFIACQLTNCSLLVKRAVSIWATYRNISTSYTTVGIHFHALKSIVQYFKNVQQNISRNMKHTCRQNLQLQACKVNHSFGT